MSKNAQYSVHTFLDDTFVAFVAFSSFKQQNWNSHARTGISIGLIYRIGINSKGGVKHLCQFHKLLIIWSYSNLGRIEPAGATCMKIKTIICVGQDFFCKMKSDSTGQRSGFGARKNSVEVPPIRERSISI